MLSPTCSGASSTELTQRMAAVAWRVVFKHCPPELFIWFQKQDLIKAQLNTQSKCSWTWWACLAWLPSRSDHQAGASPQGSATAWAQPAKCVLLCLRKRRGTVEMIIISMVQSTVYKFLYLMKNKIIHLSHRAQFYELCGGREHFVALYQKIQPTITVEQDYIFLSSKISGFLETSFLFQRPFCLAFCHLFYRFLCFLFPHIHLCCYRFASAGEAEL